MKKIMFLTLLSLLSLNLYAQSVGVDKYLPLSCEEILKKEHKDAFLKQLKNKLQKIQRSQLDSNESQLKVCDQLGEAQFSRLMEDEFLIFDKK